MINQSHSIKKSAYTIVQENLLCVYNLYTGGCVCEWALSVMDNITGVCVCLWMGTVSHRYYISCVYFFAVAIVTSFLARLHLSDIYIRVKFISIGFNPCVVVSARCELINHRVMSHRPLIQRVCTMQFLQSLEKAIRQLGLKTGNA